MLFLCRSKGDSGGMVVCCLHFPGFLQRTKSTLSCFFFLKTASWSKFPTYLGPCCETSCHSFLLCVLLLGKGRVWRRWFWRKRKKPMRQKSSQFTKLESLTFSLWRACSNDIIGPRAQWGWICRTAMGYKFSHFLFQLRSSISPLSHREALNCKDSQAFQTHHFPATFLCDPL